MPSARRAVRDAGTARPRSWDGPAASQRMHLEEETHTMKPHVVRHALCEAAEDASDRNR